MKLKEITVEQLIINATGLNPFSFVRFNDGELNCILRPGKGGNCDGHRYDPQLSKMLKLSLSMSEFYATMNPARMMVGTHKLAMGAKCGKLMEELSCDVYDSDVLVDATGTGEIVDFFECVAQDACLIGPDFLRNKAFREFVEVPKLNCFDEYERILTDASQTRSRIVLTACSLMAEPLICDLMRICPSRVYIDIGSVLDPFFGHDCRSYHKRITEETKLRMKEVLK